jgi:hypothetical protein
VKVKDKLSQGHWRIWLTGLATMSRNLKDEYSSKVKREEDIAEEISKTLDKFGSAPTYHEFQTKASRQKGRHPKICLYVSCAQN